MSRRLFSLLSFLIILYSCNSDSATDKTNSSDSKATSSQKNDDAADKNLSGTHGIFSYTVKGQHVVARNYVQQSNLFINEVSNDATNGMVQIKVTCETSNVFNFTIANSGTTTITNYSPSLGNFADKKSKVASYMDNEGGKYISYYADSVTITITSNNGSRVKGSFSGTYKAGKDEGGATITITDGSFDLPFMKS